MGLKNKFSWCIPRDYIFPIQTKTIPKAIIYNAFEIYLYTMIINN